jgi:hypothetical protein
MAARIVSSARPVFGAAMKQSRAMSLVESIINIAVGFGISLLAQWYFLPMLGVAIDFKQNLFFALIMTAVSICRQFILRRVFEALHIRRPLSPFMRAVIAERFRQIEGEGWDAAHDDQHKIGEIARAGAAYAVQAEIWELFPSSAATHPPFAPAWWPWSRSWWKPQGFRRDLVRAAALVVAEGEKFDRNRKPKRLIQGGYQPVDGPRPPLPTTGSGVQSKFERFGT